VRLEDDARPGCARDGGGAVGGIVVADDEFPAPVIESLRRLADARQTGVEQALLVVRRDDDRELQVSL